MIHRKKHTNKIIFLIMIFMLNTSCSNSNGKLSGEFKNEVIDADAFSKYITIDFSSDAKQIYYSDDVTLSIKKVINKENSWLDSYIDRVDTSEKINPVMGKHHVIRKGDAETLYYLDYQSEKRKVFKRISKLRNEENYHIDDIDIDCTDFEFPEGNDGIVFCKNGSFNVLELFDDGTYKKYSVDSDAFRDMKDFSVTETLNYLTIVYRDINEMLFIARLKKDDNEITMESTKLISENVSLFDTVLTNGDVGIIYYTNDSLVSYYESGAILRIGYFPYCSEVHVGFTGKTIYFLVSSLEDTKDGSELYSLNLIHRLKNNKKKWAEDKVVQSEVPFMAVESLINEGVLYIVSSGVNLTLSKLPMEKIE